MPRHLWEGLPVSGGGYTPDDLRNLVPVSSKGSAKVSICSFNIMILLNNFVDTVEDQSRLENATIGELYVTKSGILSDNKQLPLISRFASDRG
jgi:hypothetical protein